MGAIRSLLLKASENQWLATRLPRYPFARRAVRRFMPGEALDDALAECALLQASGINTVITRLGENITDLVEAAAVRTHYSDTVSRIRNMNVATHISVKLTQLGLDIDASFTQQSMQRLVEAAGSDPVWIDMEGSKYTDATLAIFRAVRERRENVGLCVQAYLKRTSSDLDSLLDTTTAIRLVKGAYREPQAIAFPKKAEVDACYVAAARRLMERARTGVIGYVPAFGTHDVAIIRRICEIADEMHVPRECYEFQLLYGINAAEQQRLAREGYRIRVLISYGAAWFAWYMRRLAERPANVAFLMKSVMHSG